MQPTGGSITTQSADRTEENILFTYSEAEKQQNEINEANARLVINFKYLTVPREMFLLGLNGNDILIFAFIDSWLCESPEKFYFSNATLAKTFNLSEVGVSNIITKLAKQGLIDISYKRRADGGQLRRVNIPTYKNFKYQLKESLSSNLKKVYGSSNTSINKTTNKEKEDKEKSFNEELNNELINLCMTSKQLLGKSFKNIKAITPNYRFWREQYSADEILEALRKSKYSEFWRDKMTVEILLRQKDTKGNAVDRIGEFLALEEVKSVYMKAEEF